MGGIAMIPMMGKAPEMPDPLKSLLQASQIRANRQQEALSSQAYQENALKLQAMQQNLQDQETARGILAQTGNDLKAATPLLLKALGPRAQPIIKSMMDFQKEQESWDEQKFKNAQEKVGIFKSAIDEIMGLPEEKQGEVYQQKTQELLKQGVITEGFYKTLPLQWDKSWGSGAGNTLKQIQSELDVKAKLNASKISEQNLAKGAQDIKKSQDEEAQRGLEKSAQDQFFAANPGATIEDYRTQLAAKKAVATRAPQAPSEIDLAIKAASGDKAAEAALRRLDQSKRESRPVTYMGGSDDAKAIADEIAAGRQPPTTKGLYRLGGPVRANLAKMQFNLAGAEVDWNAVQKHMAAINNSQQLRMRQAVEKIEPHVNLIEGLYSKLEKTGLPTGFSAWNKLALATASRLPGETGSLARNIEAQINDLSAELGTIYMGGNTPTDHALKQALTNLSGTWNPQTFHEAVRLIKENVDMRRQSIRFTGPAGVPKDSPYIPEQFNQTPSKGIPTAEDFKNVPKGKALKGADGNIYALEDGLVVQR
jgi:hypothetical protein